MASPLDIISKDKDVNNKIFIPKTINLAINLIQAFISNNNPLGLRVAIVLSGIKEQIEYDKDNKVKFKVEELCKLCNINKRYLSSNIKKMTETFYTYVDLDGGIGGTHPIHSYKYSSNNKYIEIEVSSKAKELFNTLSEKGINGYQFTPTISKNLMNIDLKQAHKHTLKMQMLLEMINNYTTTKTKKISLEELNGYFGTKYSRWIDIERKILVKVQSDINIYSSFSFTYEPYEEVSKNGRPRYGGIVIKIKDNTNLFSLSQQDYEQIEQNQPKNQSIRDEIQENIIIEAMISNIPQAIKEQQRVYLEERLHEFIEWVESLDNTMLNKLKKDWNKSFDRHIEGYEKNLNKLDRRL